MNAWRPTTRGGGFPGDSRDAVSRTRAPAGLRGAEARVRVERRAPAVALRVGDGPEGAEDGAVDQHLARRGVAVGRAVVVPQPPRRAVVLAFHVREPPRAQDGVLGPGPGPPGLLALARLVAPGHELEERAAARGRHGGRARGQRAEDRARDPPLPPRRRRRREGLDDGVGLFGGAEELLQLRPLRLHERRRRPDEEVPEGQGLPAPLLHGREGRAGHDEGPALEDAHGFCSTTFTTLRTRPNTASRSSPILRTMSEASCLQRWRILNRLEAWPTKTPRSARPWR